MQAKLVTLLLLGLLALQAAAINIDKISKRNREAEAVQVKQFGFVKENHECTAADVTFVNDRKAGCFDADPLDETKVCMPAECNQALLLYAKCKALFTEQDKVALDAATTKVNTFCTAYEQQHHGLCGSYLKDEPFEKEDNNNKKIKVVKVHKEDLRYPEIYDKTSDEKDNSIRTDIACMFFKMKMHALSTADAPNLLIESAFRTYARQQYFWDCYQCAVKAKNPEEKKACCNSGNKAAEPGTSNHGLGIALDLNTDCGKQTGQSPPEECNTSKVYQYLKTNAASKFGFKREEITEPWHWRYVGSGATNTAFT